ncbi:hypothetical protein Chor_005622, partial [Crotalus horridus]
IVSCSWQDLCGATTCDTLGMADVGTMCDPKRSCSVIEDDGLPSAFTTAHELGHVFNMPHDNVKACEEVFGKLKTNHMMSPTLIQIDRINPWSPCSTAIITDFLDSGHGEKETGGRSMKERWGWMATGGSGHLMGHVQGHVVEESSWLNVNATIQLQPMKESIVKGFELNIVPAVWIPALLQVRFNEVPGKSFREEQCEAFNGYNHSTNRLTAIVSWVPKYSGVSPRDKCKLICRANGTGYFYVLAPKVVDGTPCSPDSSSLCVQGKCIKAGCDGKLGSKTKFDKCGVCGGDNKSCKKVSGLFTKPMHGYNFVVLLPAGASSIDIRQRGYKGLISDDNYLALKNGHGKYLLNGHFIVSPVERDLIVKGSVIRYSGTGTAVESLQAFMPIQEPLTVEVLSVGKMTPPRVRYSFYLPKESKEDKSSYHRKDGKRPPVLNNSILSLSNRLELGQLDYKRPAYKWATTNWEDCSVTCGNGLQKRMVLCRDALGQLASSCDATQRPIDIRICGDPCPTWEASPWSSCSKTCGRGFKRRILRCTGRGGVLLPRERCNLRKKPQELDFCTLRPC